MWWQKQCNVGHISMSLNIGILHNAIYVYFITDPSQHQFIGLLFFSQCNQQLQNKIKYYFQIGDGQSTCFHQISFMEVCLFLQTCQNSYLSDKQRNTQVEQNSSLICLQQNSVEAIAHRGQQACMCSHCLDTSETSQLPLFCKITIMTLYLQK